MREERLHHRRQRSTLDPLQLSSIGIEHRDARQPHRLGQHTHDEKVVFDMIHAVIAADDLRLMNRTDDDRTRPLGLRSRRTRRKREDGGDGATEAHRRPPVCRRIICVSAVEIHRDLPLRSSWLSGLSLVYKVA
jgi:hypothetical protein